jgi:hypothetical protein
MKSTERFALSIVAVGLLAIANGCCLPGGPLCGMPQGCLTRPDKFVTSQCCDGAGCNECAPAKCGPADCDGDGCGRFECCLFRNMGQRFRSALSCGSGCGDIYWNAWYSDPPDKCDPCGCHGDYIGPQVCPDRNLSYLLWGRRGETCAQPHRCSTGNCGGCAKGNCSGSAPAFSEGEIIIEGPVIETWDSDTPPVLETPTPVIPTSRKSVRTVRKATYGRTRTSR